MASKARWTGGFSAVYTLANPMAIRAWLMEALEKKVDTRQYLIDKGLTHKDYAKRILEVIDGA